MRSRNPEARLEVVGHGVDESLRAAVGPGVAFAGGVEDIRPYLGSCSAMVLPAQVLRGRAYPHDGGRRDGYARREHSVGVAGMGLEAGNDYLEGQTGAEIALALLHLLRDGGEARRIGTNARPVGGEEYLDGEPPRAPRCALREDARARRRRGRSGKSRGGPGAAGTS